MRLIGVMLVCVGCHSGGTVTPDTPVDPDGPVHGLGMFVTWRADPELPGDVTDKITVSDATFQLEHLQLVSDAGADGRTTHSRYQLRWGTGAVPALESFPNAPVAMYQRIAMDLRPGSLQPFAYQIQGTFDDDNSADTERFRIVNPMPMSLPIDCNVTLAPGGSVSIVVKIDLKDALGRIDFKNVPEIAGVHVLSGGPMLNDLNKRLVGAFEAKLED